MTVLADHQIQNAVVIEPFSPSQKRKGVISYGVSSYGYDVRVGSKFKVFHQDWSAGAVPIVDPKNFDEEMFYNISCGTDDDSNYCIIPPNSFALTETVEYFEIPRDILVVCVGKSTYARCGIIVNVTPLEPEWRGKITIEISNTTPLPAKIYANEGIAQLIFFKADEMCDISYADKSGKYQDQEGLKLPEVD